MCASNDKEIYYTLMVMWEEEGEYSAEFGSFDLEEVRQERDDEYSDTDEIVKTKIVESLEERS